MQETTSQAPESKKPLEFTGNWFIDAGILGVVRRMKLLDMRQLLVSLTNS